MTDSVQRQAVEEQLALKGNDKEFSQNFPPKN